MSVGDGCGCSCCRSGGLNENHGSFLYFGAVKEKRENREGRRKSKEGYGAVGREKSYGIQGTIPSNVGGRAANRINWRAV